MLMIFESFLIKILLFGSVAVHSIVSTLSLKLYIVKVEIGFTSQHLIILCLTCILDSCIPLLSVL